jgi:hypothetical protein
MGKKETKKSTKYYFGFVKTKYVHLLFVTMHVSRVC